jgi:hypothetical protein
MRRGWGGGGETKGVIIFKVRNLHDFFLLSYWGAAGKMTSKHFIVSFKDLHSSSCKLFMSQSRQ